MRGAYWRIMALSLVRDRATLAMNFVLPGLVFVIFAMIFSGATGGDITVRLAVYDARDSSSSQRLLSSLSAMEQITLSGPAAASRAELRARVVDGDADIGLEIRANGTGFDQLEAGSEAPLGLYIDPLRSIAASVTQGALQAAWSEALPGARIAMAARLIDEIVVPLRDEQKEAVALGVEALNREGGLESGALYDLQQAAEGGAAQASVTYYAAAVSILFLLLASLNGALSLLDEKASGIFQRQLMGPGGAGAMIDGKFGFLVMMGLIQVSMIYLVAWQLFDVDFISHLGPWIVTTLAASACAAGLALFFVSCCRTRQQAETLGNITILVLAALGGSMVPRFLMPLELQQLGWLTPNTWALEAYEGVFRRGDELAALAIPIGLMCLMAVLGLLGARLMVARTGL